MKMSSSHSVIVAGCCLLAAFGCSQPDAQKDAPLDSQAAHVAEVAAAGGTIDSLIPSAERLRRFRATISERPDTLRHASPSMEHLVARWAAAVQSRDSAALNAMVIDRAEFAWLYFPTARLALPPYDMPPALLWEQVLANSDAGARTVLERLGGRVLVVRSMRCPKSAEAEGANLVRQDCLVRLRSASDTLPEARYFGSIIERDGRFKFLGFANKL